jgi:hypothetical protein
MILATPGTPAQRSQRIASASTTCSSANDSDVSTARASDCRSVLAAIQFDQDLASGWPGLEFPMRATMASSGRSGSPIGQSPWWTARLTLTSGPQDALNAARRPALLSGSGEAYHAVDFKT